MIDTWNITNNIDNETIINYLNNSICNNTYLLDLQKCKSNYSLIEQIVYNIATYHFNRLNIDVNNSFVEFWWKTNSDVDNFHLDCDENIKKTTGLYIHPLLSCVTYFNNHNCPTILTNINFEDYKYKNFKDKNIIYMSFPKEGKHITFDSTLYHGISNIFQNNEYTNLRYMLAINLWNKKPSDIIYYNNEVNISNINNVETTITPSISENMFNIIKTNKEIINFNLFEKLLYKKEKDLFINFGNLININNNINNLFNDNLSSCFKFVRNDNEEVEKLEASLKTKYGDIINDINYIMNETNNIKYNRFLQRFQYKKIYSPDVCKWIINECEFFAANNGGWTTKRHNNYPTTDLPIQLVKPIFNYIYESFKTISDLILKSYCLEGKNITLNFKDVFVVKYEFNKQNYLDLHHDGSFLSFQILLSDSDSFEGGGTYFDDGLIMYPEKGDLVIHSSRIKHGGLPITKGVRYLLVGFIDLNLQVEELNN